MTHPTVCMVARLVGDAWMNLPGIVRLSQQHGGVRLIAGTYALPVWEFAQKYVEGLNLEILGTVDDPDHMHSPFWPSQGFLSMDPAYTYACAKFGLNPKDVLKVQAIPYAYGYPPVVQLRFRDGLLREDPHIALQGGSSHFWKNCGYVVTRARYASPTRAVGFSGEFTGLHESWTGRSYEDQVKCVLSARAVCSVLSSFAALAAVTGKRLLLAGYKDDILVKTNPERTRLLVVPSLDQYQTAVEEMGL